MCSATVRLSRLTAVLLLLAGVLALAQQSATQLALDEAAAAFEQGKAAEAERKLESILKGHPTELRALILAGAVLDSQQRLNEAESYYQRASLNLMSVKGYFQEAQLCASVRKC